MALTKCIECNNNISDSARACPKCGYPIAPQINLQRSETQSSGSGAIVVVAIIIFLLIFGWYSGFFQNLFFREVQVEFEIRPTVVHRCIHGNIATSCWELVCRTVYGR